MPSFCAVFKCGNNFKSDGDKSYFWLLAVVTRLGPLREKLSRVKEREGAVRRQISGGQREFVYTVYTCLQSFTGILVMRKSYLDVL